MGDGTPNTWAWVIVGSSSRVPDCRTLSLRGCVVGTGRLVELDLFGSAMVEDGRLTVGQPTGGLVKYVLVVDVGKPGQFLEGRRCRILGSETCRSSQVSVEIVPIVGSGLTLQGLEDGGQLFVGDDDRNCWSGWGRTSQRPRGEWQSGSSRTNKVGERTDGGVASRKGDYSLATSQGEVRRYSRYLVGGGRSRETKDDKVTLRIEARCQLLVLHTSAGIPVNR